MRGIIQFSAFDQGEEEEGLVVKELAIVNVDLSSCQSWIFKNPFPITEMSLGLRFSNEYLSRHVFGLDWNHGDIPYQELKSIVIKYTEHIGSLYTHGRRRQKFLETILERTVNNLEDLQCPKSSELSFPIRTCAHYLHQFGKYRCELKDAWQYANYLNYFDLSQYILTKPEHHVD